MKYPAQVTVICLICWLLGVSTSYAIKKKDKTADHFGIKIGLLKGGTVELGTSDWETDAAVSFRRDVRFSSSAPILPRPGHRHAQDSGLGRAVFRGCLYAEWQPGGAPGDSPGEKRLAASTRPRRRRRSDGGNRGPGQLDLSAPSPRRWSFWSRWVREHKGLLELALLTGSGNDGSTDVSTGGLLLIRSRPALLSPQKFTWPNRPGLLLL